MALLTPKLAALVAKQVYEVRTGTDLATLMKVGDGPAIAKEFAVGDTSRFTGTSGPTFLGTSTGFGYVAPGTGARAGEALVAIRGTHFTSLADWWSNANAGMTNGPGAGPVHAGFHNVFSSFRDTLGGFFSGGKYTHIHCVGHSLGGALATLTAAWLDGQKLGRVTLYTFGSPRVGSSGFAKGLTSALGKNNIFRAYHTADPVSMVPIFPFSHVPDGDPGVFLNYKDSTFSPDSHGMEKYEESVKRHSSWLSMKRAAPKSSLSKKVDAWLESASSGSVQMFSTATFWMISEAITYLLKKSAGMVIGAAITGTITLLDQVVWLLHQGARISKEIADGLQSVVKMIFRFLGRAVVETADLTTQFLRWVLDLLVSNVANFVRRAVSILPQ